jgi:hypothetical protein
VAFHGVCRTTWQQLWVKFQPGYSERSTLPLHMARRRRDLLTERSGSAEQTEEVAAIQSVSLQYAV